MSKDATKTKVEPGDGDAANSERRAEALAIIKRHSGYGAVAGLLPLPIVDVAAVTTIQVRMLAQLSSLYGVPFSENAVKASVTALIGGVLPTAVGVQTGFSLMKALPVVGTLAAIAVVPGLSAAMTWAVGRVFLSHFESGGTTLDFDPSAMKSRFQSELDKFQGRQPAEATEATPHAK